MELDARKLETFETLYEPIDDVNVAMDDHEGLIKGWERVDDLYRRMKRIRGEFARALWKQTKGKAKTRRVRGGDKVAKVEAPRDFFEQSALKEAWEKYPQLREELLKISEIGVKRRELNKAKETAGGPAYNAFVKIITSAYNENEDGSPKITIER